MPPASLIPDRQLTFSPDLAATIGLEEAILMQYLGPLLAAQSDPWCQLNYDALSQHFPFWSREKLRDLLLSLEALGVIVLSGQQDVTGIRVATAEAAGQLEKPAPESPRLSTPASWQPPDAVYDVLQMNHGIDRQFDIHVSFYFATPSRIRKFFGRLCYHRIAIIIEPIDEWADR